MDAFIEMEKLPKRIQNQLMKKIDQAIIEDFYYNDYVAYTKDKYKGKVFLREVLNDLKDNGVVLFDYHDEYGNGATDTYGLFITDEGKIVYLDFSYRTEGVAHSDRYNLYVGNIYYNLEEIYDDKIFIRDEKLFFTEKGKEVIVSEKGTEYFLKHGDLIGLNL